MLWYNLVHIINLCLYTDWWHLTFNYEAPEFKCWKNFPKSSSEFPTPHTLKLYTFIIPFNFLELKLNFPITLVSEVQVFLIIFQTFYQVMVKNRKFVCLSNNNLIYSSLILFCFFFINFYMLVSVSRHSIINDPPFQTLRSRNNQYIVQLIIQDYLRITSDSLWQYEKSVFIFRPHYMSSSKTVTGGLAKWEIHF